MRRDIIKAAMEAAERIEAVSRDVEILTAALNCEAVDAKDEPLRTALQNYIDEAGWAMIKIAISDEA